MDSLITAAATALARGDVLGALNRVALRSDPPALALRGIAMAQLGDFSRARTLLRRAARAFGLNETVARARCVLAEAEIALAARDLDWPGSALRAASQVLRRRGDQRNALYARLLEARRSLLLGRLDEADVLLRHSAVAKMPDSLQAVHALLSAGIALRRLRINDARQALARAAICAGRSGIVPLAAEIRVQARVLEVPAARLRRGGEERLVALVEIEALHRSRALLIDATRRVVWRGSATIPFGRRPVLWRIVAALAGASPGDVPRESLIGTVFRIRRPDATHRARLRVEMGRLRRQLQGLARVVATRRGYVLQPAHAAGVALLLPAVDEPHTELLAALSDGEPWSSSALALAVGGSQRHVQRLLEVLEAKGRVRTTGRGRAQRWIASATPGIATILLLPGALPGT